MCTVVVRWHAGRPAQVLALRDELTTRPFDDPDRWWPDHPTVVGGRDQQAGGSWCVTDVATAVTALVLNRPERRVAGAGALSRGVLPLLAVQHGRAWPDRVDLTGMASFTVVLVSSEALLLWDFDGARLTAREVGEGTHMVTSGGAEDGKATRFLPAFARSEPQDWPGLVAQRRPADDPAALLVRHELAAERKVFATVFGQYLEAVPGSLRLACSRHPEQDDWAVTTVTAVAAVG